jgi:hypothetical protein
MRMRSPIGWRGNSYGHALAAKGIQTTPKKYFSQKRYFASDVMMQPGMMGSQFDGPTYSPGGSQLPQPLQEQSALTPSQMSDRLKGNRKDPSDIQSLRMKKWTDQAILNNADMLKSQGLLSEASESYLQNKLRTKASAIPEAPSQEVGSPLIQSDLSAPDVPVTNPVFAPVQVSAPSVNLDALEDDLPRQNITVSPEFDFNDTTEASQGTPAGLRRQMALSPTVMTPGAPEAIPDYDLKV